MRLLLVILLLPIICNSQVTLTYDGITSVQPNTPFELSIKAGEPMDVGAISLYMGFPSDKLQILDVYMATGGSMLYNPMGDTLAIGWFGPPFLYLSTGDTILTIRLVSTYCGAMAFTLLPYCDFGDLNFQSMPALIMMNTMDCATGVNDYRGKQKQGETVYYNIQGQRMTEPKGIYIINHKKYIKL